MALDAGSVFAVLGGKFNPAGFAQFDAAMKKSTASASAAEKSHARSAGAMTAMGAAAKTGAAVGVVALGYALVESVKSAATFEKKMSELQAVTKANTATMKTMSKAALDLGASTGVGATEAAGALTELAKGGLDAETSIAALKGTIDLAQAGEMQLAEAANTVVQSLSLFNLAGSDASHVADGLASAAAATTMDVADFAQALAQGGSAAAAAGFSFDDTINVMAAMANKFKSGSDLGTSLKTTLVQMANPSAKAAAEMKRLNISLFDSNNKIKPVASIVKMLTNRFEGMSDKQKLSTAATIAGTDGMRTLLALLGGSGKDIIVPGSAADIAAKKMDNFAGASKRLSAEIESLKIEAGQGVTPALADATNAVTKFLAQMREGKGAGGVFSSIVGILWSVQKALYSVVTGAGTAFIALLEGIARAGAFFGVPGAEKAADDLTKMRRELAQTTQELLPFQNAAKKPVNVKIIANKQAAINSIKEVENSKIAPKVAKVLGSTGDATTKIGKLIQLGIPLKLAKTLTNAGSTQKAIQRLKDELATIRNPPPITLTLNAGGAQKAWDLLGGKLGPAAASGAGAGTARASLVGEGGGPEWIVDRSTGQARKVTGAQMANLNENEYVIPTESKYRPQALGLLSMLAADLGVQGFAPGKAAKKKLAAAKKRKYAYQDGRIQSASDAATLYQTRMNTAETSGNATLYEGNKKALADALKLELNRIISAVNLKGKLKPTGARLTMLKQNQADVEGLIAANNAAKFPSAALADETTYSADEQKQLDELGRQLAMAELTTEITDDQGVLAAKEKYLAGILTGAGMGAGRGGVTAVTQIAGDLKSTRDQLAGLTPTTPGITPDQQAQADQTARNQTMAAQSAAIDRLVGATLGGSPTLVFQSYVPPSPTEARRLADYTVGGIGYQGATQSSKDSVGI